MSIENPTFDSNRQTLAANNEPAAMNLSKDMSAASKLGAKIRRRLWEQAEGHSKMSISPFRGIL